MEIEAYLAIIMGIGALAVYISKVLLNVSSSRPENITLEDGISTIVAVWSWKKLGWVRKEFKIINGKLHVTYLD